MVEEAPLVLEAEDSEDALCPHTSAYVRIRQHTSAYVSIHQHTSAFAAEDFEEALDIYLLSRLYTGETESF